MFGKKKNSYTFTCTATAPGEAYITPTIDWASAIQTMDYSPISYESLQASRKDLWALEQANMDLRSRMDELQNQMLVSGCCWSPPQREPIKVEGNCPSCGAPITGDKCEYCGRVHYIRR